MAANRNSFNKRRREIEKKQQAEEKRQRKRLKREGRGPELRTEVAVPMRAPDAQD
jgi:hypothetical protein